MIVLTTPSNTATTLVLFDALISTEDERYLEHPGIDLKAVARAAINAGGAGGAVAQGLMCERGRA